MKTCSTIKDEPSQFDQVSSVSPKTKKLLLEFLTEMKSITKTYQDTNTRRAFSLKRSYKLSSDVLV